MFFNGHRPPLFKNMRFAKCTRQCRSSVIFGWYSRYTRTTIDVKSIPRLRIEKKTHFNKNVATFFVSLSPRSRVTHEQYTRSHAALYNILDRYIITLTLKTIFLFLHSLVVTLYYFAYANNLYFIIYGALYAYIETKHTQKKTDIW